MMMMMMMMMVHIVTPLRIAAKRTENTPMGFYPPSQQSSPGAHHNTLLTATMVVNDLNVVDKFSFETSAIKVAFAMTINKAQGQSKLSFIYHGQLYVALSRSGNPLKTKKYMPKITGLQGKFEGKEGYYTKNVVYQEVLSTFHTTTTTTTTNNNPVVTILGVNGN